MRILQRWKEQACLLTIKAQFSKFLVTRFCPGVKGYPMHILKGNTHENTATCRQLV